jgi:hypothetical protein
MVNAGSLEDGAFQPRLFAVRIEQGLFEPPAATRSRSKGFYCAEPDLHYTRRLVFDPSPYPPESQWKRTRWFSSNVAYWEWKEFVGKSPRVEKFIATTSYFPPDLLDTPKARNAS